MDLSPGSLLPPLAGHLSGAALTLALLAPRVALAQMGSSAEPLRALPLGASVVALLVALLALYRWRVRRRLALARIGPAPEAFDAEQLLELLDISCDWLWKTNEQHRYIHVTQGLRTHSMIDPRDFLGHTPWELDCGGAPENWQTWRHRIAQHAPVRRRCAVATKPADAATSS